jgi:hypothetical protein
MAIGLLTYREKSFYLSQVDSPEYFIPTTGLTCSWMYLHGVNMTKLTRTPWIPPTVLPSASLTECNQISNLEACQFVILLC